MQWEGLQTTAHPLRPAPYPLQTKAHPLRPAPYPLQTKTHPLRPAPYPLQTKAYPLHPAPYPLQTKAHPVRPAPYPLKAKAYLLRPAPYPLQTKAYPLRPAPYPLQEAPYFPGQIPRFGHSGRPSPQRSTGSALALMHFPVCRLLINTRARPFLERFGPLREPLEKMPRPSAPPIAPLRENPGRTHRQLAQAAGHHPGAT